MNIRYTPDPIDPKNMGKKDIFVFGSNTLGHHNGGAAKAAMLYYNAVYGQARGLQGNSYAIVTIDRTGKEIIDLHTISQEVDLLIEFAKIHKDLTFWMTKIGCGISGYTINDIAPIFFTKTFPDNIILPIEFSK